MKRIIKPTHITEREP